MKARKKTTRRRVLPYTGRSEEKVTEQTVGHEGEDRMGVVEWFIPLDTDKGKLVPELLNKDTPRPRAGMLSRQILCVLIVLNHLRFIQNVAAKKTGEGSK